MQTDKVRFCLHLISVVLIKTASHYLNYLINFQPLFHLTNIFILIQVRFYHAAFN